MAGSILRVPPRLPALLACPPPGARTLWLTNAHLIDGTGAPPRHRAAVLVQDGRIARVGDASHARPEHAMALTSAGAPSCRV